MKRGLRQGDPLSPFLFLIMAEVLNKMLLKAEAMGFFKGVEVGGDQVKVTHLQFADDTLIFCEPNMEFLTNIKRLLSIFQDFSGLAVNYAKTGLIVIGKDAQWAEEAATTLQCSRVELPITYLGVPLGANMNRAASWQPIIERIQNRLSSWKPSCLSRAGKLTLIRAVLNSLPVYYLSIFRMPKKVAAEINRIQTRFLWSSKKEGKFAALVKWDIVQRPKNQGGLGVGDLLVKNAALLFKWWWRYACEEGTFWRRVIQSLYEEDQGILVGNDNPKLNGPWRAIKKLASEKSPVTTAFFTARKIQIGENSKILFWKDVWLKEQPLRLTFPTLYNVSSQKEETVSSMGWFEGRVWRWTLSWNSQLTDVAQQELGELQALLANHHPERNGRDTMKWGSKETFTVKELILRTNKLLEAEAMVDSLVCTVWKNIAPPKVEFMLWLALLGKLNTRELLVKKGVLPSHENKCSFCSQQSEDFNHLLLKCQYSWSIWCNFAAEFGVLMAEQQRQQDFRQFYEWWLTKNFHSQHSKKEFILTFFAIAWSLWTERNKIVFEQQTLEMHILQLKIRWRIEWWKKAWKSSPRYTAEQRSRT